MAQAGMHALVGAAAGKLTAKRDWLLLGVVLGSLFTDLDNYAVAIATLAKMDSHGLHRTFTHSIFTILAVLLVFFIIAQVRKELKWNNLGIGIGIGLALHMALDLLIWFNGVELLWPLGGWVNLWENVQPPEWFAKFLEPAEFLFFGLFFAWLLSAARAHGTDTDFVGKLRGWTIAMFILLLIFTPLAYLMGKGFNTIYGLVYLVSLTAAFVIAIRMRQTIEA